MKFAFASVLLVLLGASFLLGQDLPAKSGKMVTFEVVIADLVGPLDAPTAAKILELEKSGKYNFLTRVQVTSLEEQTASVQFGEVTTRPTGRPAAGRGFVGGPLAGRAVSNSPSVNVGTLVQVTARIEQDGSIVAQLMAQRSGLNADPERPIDRNDGAAQSVERLTTETTLRLKPGEPQLVGGRQATAGQETNRTWIVITARVGGKAAAAAK